MIGILGGMGTQAGLDFCNKLAMLNRGKIDQEYPLFMLIINLIYLEDQSQLAFKLKDFQIFQEISKVTQGITKF